MTVLGSGLNVIVAGGEISLRASDDRVNAAGGTDANGTLTISGSFEAA